MQQTFIIQCKKCGSPYKVMPKFKFCQCVNCPWVMIEHAKYSYGIIKKNLDIPLATYVGVLYEQRNVGGPLSPLREEKKKDKKKRFHPKPKPFQEDYSHLIPTFKKKDL